MRAQIIRRCYYLIKTNLNIQLGFLLFLVSEAFLFLSLFWAYYNFALSQDFPTRRFPRDQKIVDGFRVPMLRTAVLLCSRFFCTIRLHCVHTHDLVRAFLRLFFSISLRVLFTLLQYKEYYETDFTIMSRTFRRVFFLATGFHRAHVIIGTTFLGVSLIRVMKRHFSARRNIGLIASIWYWHFVDVVWIFLYLIFYASYYPLFNISEPHD